MKIIFLFDDCPLFSIVLEAGYFLQDRAFFDNIGTILLYAVVVCLGFSHFCHKNYETVLSN